MGNIDRVMSWLLTGVTLYHAQIGLSEKKLVQSKGLNLNNPG